METQVTTFDTAIIEGLSAPCKYLPSVYLYDDEGSRAFQRIMDMESYYLTDCENEILSMQSNSLYRALGFSDWFNIVELGAGDGTKTIRFLSHLYEQKVKVNYIPVDISQGAQSHLLGKLKQAMPHISVRPWTGNYHEFLNKPLSIECPPTLFLFLGSNIGNYEANERKSLLDKMYHVLRQGDKLLLGADLKKNPHIIQHAYNDLDGITKQFNLNLLVRLNKDFGANFNLSKFDFYCTYDPRSGAVRSYLVSMCEQGVYLQDLSLDVYFNKHECIHTELSQKYSLDNLEYIATESQFQLVQHFVDSKGYFSDSLFQKD